MPVATSFTALGRGNGFPFCVDKVDVSGFNYWMTLGGFKKTDGGSPTKKQIELSLFNACRLYWTTYKVNGTVTYNEPNDSESIDVENDLDEGQETPFDRLKPDARRGFGVRMSSSPSPNFTYFYFRMYGPDLHNPDADLPLPDGDANGGVVRMYNGDITNEDNFVGYGMESAPELFLYTAKGIHYMIVDGSSIDIHVYIGSYHGGNGYDQPDEAYTSLPVVGETEGIPVVGVSWVAYFPLDPDMTQDAKNLTTISGSSKIKIDSIEFYTFQ